MATHAPTITTPLPPHTTSKPQQSQRTKHHHNLNIVIVADARIHRTHNLVTTRRGRLIHNAIHSRVRRSRMRNPRRTTTACTMESCIIPVSAVRLRGALVAECLSDGRPGDVALTVSGGDGLRARPGINGEHVAPIALTGHLTVHVRTGRQAGRSGGLNRTNPQPPRICDLTPITPTQIRDRPILFHDERTPQTVPHRPGVPQARTVLLILRLTRRSLRHVNGGTSRREHPPTVGSGRTLSRIGRHTTHQGKHPSHQGHHRTAHNLAHLTVPFGSPHHRGRVADDPNHTPHETGHVNPQPTTRNVTYTIEHTYTQPPTHTRTHATNTPTHKHTNTASENKHQHARPAQTPKITTTK